MGNSENENRINNSAGLAAGLAIGSAHATQLVTNGEFTELSNGVGQLTTNTIATGWVVPAGGYTFVFTQADATVPGQYGGLALWDAANSGNNTWNGLAAGAGNFAAIDGDFQNQPLTQTITNLTVGKTYTLSFNYAFGQQYGFNGATVQSLAADIGSTTWDSGNFNVASHGFTGWQLGDISFTATSVSELLSFAATGNLPVPPFALVSKVFLTVPEPATWAMMGLGFAGLGFAAYRRRAKLGAFA
jgi:hypothetical protein